MNDDVRAALEQTRFLIARGWCQNMPTQGYKRCLVGALAEAPAGGDTGRLSYQVWGDALKVLEGLLPPNFQTLVTFNDNPATGQDDVLALLDEALK
jgi:hypothetical protein